MILNYSTPAKDSNVYLSYGGTTSYSTTNNSTSYPTSIEFYQNMFGLLDDCCGVIIRSYNSPVSTHANLPRPSSYSIAYFYILGATIVLKNGSWGASNAVYNVAWTGILASMNSLSTDVTSISYSSNVSGLITPVYYSGSTDLRSITVGVPNSNSFYIGSTYTLVPIYKVS